MLAAEAPGPERPVFIIGTGRCGSTILFDCLSRHRQSEPCRDLVAGDVLPGVARELRAAVSQLLSGPRTRPVLKLTVAKASLDQADLLEPRYEEVCTDPVGVVRRAAEFAELPWTPAFEAEIRRTRIRNANDRWRRDLTPTQQHLLQKAIAGALQRYGYG